MGVLQTTHLFLAEKARRNQRATSNWNIPDPDRRHLLHYHKNNNHFKDLASCISIIISLKATLSLPRPSKEWSKETMGGNWEFRENWFRNDQISWSSVYFANLTSLIMNNCSWQKIVPSKSLTLVSSHGDEITLTVQDKKPLK